ncbi:hypothetical protein UCREL1_6796 [Eutypa lata UCREL1]|uniref:F-box domain-containing protein n=1 Tax=Eutypa lata (strain UCR-EL1) TaxID=1287681 RepID=M7SP55_EUTLA|nr:hypothetical protein UCREL1_6796 [Eutypa lata UCREL1]
MLLLQLPPEILLCILDELGHEFFSKDLSRLTISRLWYDLAWKVFSRDLPFTAWPLIKFTKNETAFLGSSEVLVGMLKRCQSLRCLKIKVGPDCPELDIERPAYLMVKPLAGLLAIQNLTSVGLQYKNLSGSITACRYSKDCQSTARKSFLDLKEAIEGQATTLAHQLENPRMVRVISHEVPSLKVFAFNALTGRRAELENNIEWDADGEEVVEEVEESDDENDRDLFDDDSLPEPWIDLAAESNF